MAAKSANKQKLFNGRDTSWMQFNRRVLEEAEDPANPLLERVKFLAITGSNLAASPSAPTAPSTWATRTRRMVVQEA